MGAGNCLFFARKMRFHALGVELGFTGQKTPIENGNEIKIRQDSH